MRRPKITALFLLLLAPAVARADGVAQLLAPRAGKTIDLRADPALRDQLVARGLVAKDANEVTVDAALLQEAFASDRFFNHVNVLRYHVGDRIIVQDPGSGGDYSHRAEILEVLPGGRYRVKVWDKPEALTHDEVGHTDVFTGKLLKANVPSTTVRYSDQGQVFTKVLAEPWLERVNQREVILSHDQVDALNGAVRPRGTYKIGRWEIDPANDPVLRDAIARARKIADEVLPASKLVLPTDPTARKAALEDVARLQEQLLTKIYNDNVMSNPLRNENAKKRLAELPLRRPDLVGKIGGILESKAGICVEQAAAIQAILEGIGDRGFTSRAMGGNTIENNFGHGFLIVRLADGRPYMFDPAWHGQGDKHALDNLDFATFDARNHSNRRINWVTQATTDPTPFFDRSTEEAITLSRGYDTGAGETYLALRAREAAKANGGTTDDAAAQIVALHELEGSFAARAVAERARALTFDSATPGILGGLRDIGGRTAARNDADAR